MKRLFILITLVLCSTVCIKSSAKDLQSTCYVATGSAGLAEVASNNANAKAKELNSSVGEITKVENDGKIQFNRIEYSKLSSADKATYMEYFLDQINLLSMGTADKGKYYNFIAGQDESVTAAIKYLKSDTRADFAKAQGWFRPFSGPISTFLGFMVIMMFSFLSISFVFDLSYLVIPMFRVLLERGEPEKKPWGVSTEAWQAKVEVEDKGATYKNAVKIYIGHRLPNVFLMTLMLGWLISGKLYDIVGWIMDSFNFS